MEVTESPKAITCFSNGISFVEIQLTLASGGENTEFENETMILKSEETKPGQCQECLVGPLPSSVVMGTIGLVAEDPKTTRIISLREIKKKKEKLKIPCGPDFSFQEFLASNLETSVGITFEKEEGKDLNGVVKWVQDGKAIIEEDDGNDRLISLKHIKEIKRTTDILDEDEKGKYFLILRISTLCL